MATCGENCRLCHESLPPKHRRTIFTETFKVFAQLTEVLGYIPRVDDGISKYVCGYCFTKLNKLSKIEFDIAHRLEALNTEKISLIKMLRAKYLQYEMSGQSTVQSVPTPLSAEMLPGMQPPSTPGKQKSSTPDRNPWLAKMQ